ncbi:TonB-dependent copper receptor [Termitidicoccus mucosus]|uniref:TonB-dependent copper receptor n=1 Tax=Termitidicoccus mucosus TaxID=1184151 RepID=UPI0009FF372C
MTILLSQDKTRPAAALVLGALLNTLALAAAPARPLADSEPVTHIEPLVVTAPAVGDRPLQVTIDTQAAAQPIPAQDGADIIKSIPGVTISRKGGTGGEVILRGAAGSRLDILVDHESILGGCPNRMDPPTAYIFPGAYDNVTLLKGPQSVRYGPGNSAGVVLFKNDPVHLDAPSAALDASFVLGSFGRNDQSAAVLAGTPQFYARIEGVRTESDDYEDGNGDKVHSRYKRTGGRLALGWTPDARTVVELHGSLSNGEAAYAHSMMDAARLDRENIGLRFEKTDISPLVETVEASLYYNHIDHVMDNYSLRAFVPSMMMPMPSSSNPRHELYGGRALATLALADSTKLTFGADFQSGRHSTRNATGSADDAEINTQGIFAELTRTFAGNRRLIAGARLNSWHAEDKRAVISGMMGATPNPTAGADRNEVLPAAFLRYEHDLAAVPVTLYAGIGYTRRAPDYWELFSYQGIATSSAFHASPEKTTQLDAGATWRRGALTAFVSLFANDVSDHILIHSSYPKGMGSAAVTRNIDSRAWGGEAGVTYALWERLQIDASIAHVRGENRTDDLPLAQQPPLEGRVSLTYATPVWSAGVLSRLVAGQDRYALNQGGIAGQDIGATGGFAVLSLNAGWQITRYAQLTAGIDNLLDKTYAEHVNRAGSGDPGYVQNIRVNEPGRTFWIKFRLSF